MVILSLLAVSVANTIGSNNELFQSILATNSSNNTEAGNLTIILEDSEGNRIFAMKDIPVVCGDGGFEWTVGDPCNEWR
jgi:hypothetical protein